MHVKERPTASIFVVALFSYLRNAFGEEEVGCEVFRDRELPLDEELLVLELLRETDRLREDVAARVQLRFARRAHALRVLVQVGVEVEAVVASRAQVGLRLDLRVARRELVADGRLRARLAVVNGSVGVLHVANRYARWLTANLVPMSRENCVSGLKPSFMIPAVHGECDAYTVVVAHEVGKSS